MRTLLTVTVTVASALDATPNVEGVSQAIVFSPYPVATGNWLRLTADPFFTIVTVLAEKSAPGYENDHRG